MSPTFDVNVGLFSNLEVADVMDIAAIDTQKKGHFMLPIFVGRRDAAELGWAFCHWGYLNICQFEIHNFQLSLSPPAC